MNKVDLQFASKNVRVATESLKGLSGFYSTQALLLKKIKQIMVPNRINTMSNLVVSLLGFKYWFKRRKVWF